MSNLIRSSFYHRMIKISKNNTIRLYIFNPPPQKKIVFLITPLIVIAFSRKSHIIIDYIHIRVYGYRVLNLYVEMLKLLLILNENC